jgi:tRNA-intron endonuclease, archaea type
MKAKKERGKTAEETIDEETLESNDLAEEGEEDSGCECGEDSADDDFGDDGKLKAPAQDFLQEVFKRAPKKVYNGVLTENKVYIWSKQDAEEIYDLGCFGKVIEDKNELSLEEALLLSKRNKLKIIKDDKELTPEDFYKYASSIDKEFPWKYAVFEELRGRGLLVRTGFKFGTHFRVYARGVKLKRGPKSVKEHTKWIVHAIPENYTCSFPELSRAVRLAHNIRAKMLWALVDEEGDVTYYEVLRKTP